MRFAGRTVIVTGGGSGIGESCAARFAAEGASVVVADWNGDAALRVAQRINGEGGAAEAKALAVQADVASDADARRIVELAIERFGRLDVLYNNAAVILPKPLEDIEEAEFDRVIAVNLKGVFLMTKHAAAHLRRSRGTIVNMASLNGLVGQRMNPAYAASKGAIVALTKSLALDFADAGVRVNCVCPAGVLTPLLEAWTQRQDDPAATLQALNDMHPLGRPASPEEIARAVLYLAGDDSAFVTGVALPVDGGAMLGY